MPELTLRTRKLLAGMSSLIFWHTLSGLLTWKLKTDVLEVLKALRCGKALGGNVFNVAVYRALHWAQNNLSEDVLFARRTPFCGPSDPPFLCCTTL
jgi:hypothetical protein